MLHQADATWVMASGRRAMQAQKGSGGPNVLHQV
eukprot:COSAG01_NODE_957_length_12474_cov_44.298182_18_plen_34_part_00